MVLPTTYDPLPSSDHSPSRLFRGHRWTYRQFLGGKTRFLFLISIGLFGFFAFFPKRKQEVLAPVPDVVHEDKLPSLFPEYREAERKLPQHDRNLPFPEGETGRYVRFENQIWGVGLGNQLEEMLLYTHLAYLSGRAYVFTPYVWNALNNDLYVADDRYGKTVPSKIPLSAFITGPTVGAPWPPGDKAARTVMDEYWDQVCPRNERRELYTEEEEPKLGLQRGYAEGIDIMEKWARHLRDMPERCVYLNGWSWRIFDIEIFVSPRVLSLWPSFTSSPTMKGFGWSKTVISGVERNLPLLVQPPPAEEANTTTTAISNELAYPIPGLVAVHVRRGDYEEHCEFLANVSWPYMGWNALPELPDKFTPITTEAMNWSPAKKWRSALTHCYPSIGHMSVKLESVRLENPHLKTVYVLSNVGPAWLNLMRDVLLDDGWSKIVTSADRELDWEESGVDQAIDMEIASRAELFVGNGFSSLTSHITMLRLTRGLSADSIRFW